MNKKIIPLIFSLLFGFTTIHAQDNAVDTLAEKPAQQLSIGIEYRPRTELRRGYRSLPNDTSRAAFFTSHRARINIDYQIKNLKLHTSLQDIRVWGDTDPRDASGKAQFYEFYVEPSFNKNFSVRVGRQRIAFDNERLFAQNDWRQTGGKHDAVRFMYKGKTLEADLIGAYNQTAENEFGTVYDTSWDIYKVLIANFLKYNATENITLTGINFLDGYTNPATGGVKTHYKYTNGGRIEYEKGSLYLTFAGYYQHGQIETGEKLKAFYLEPEIKWKASSNYSFRMGAQVASGDKNSTDGISHSFLSQYGSAHRYNGRMDYAQKTLRTYNHEGLINPYIIQDIKLYNKLKLSWESHILATQQALSKTANGATKKLDKYYGFENDFRFQYKANEFTAIEFAYMFLLPGQTLESLPTGINGDGDNIAQFAYLQITWTPPIFNWKQ